MIIDEEVEEFIKSSDIREERNDENIKKLGSSFDGVKNEKNLNKMVKDIERIIEDNQMAEDEENENEEDNYRENMEIDGQIKTNNIKTEKKSESHKKEKHGFTRLPMAKIKNIMKQDPDIKLCQKNSYYVVARLTELFLQEVAHNAHSVAKINKRKTMNLEDIACAVKSIEKYSFVDINSIFNIETIEDLKAKEEKFEKKIRQVELKMEKNDKRETKESKKVQKSVDGNKKNNNNKTNLRIDQMFFGK